LNFPVHWSLYVLGWCYLCLQITWHGAESRVKKDYRAFIETVT